LTKHNLRQLGVLAGLAALCLALSGCGFMLFRLLGEAPAPQRTQPAERLHAPSYEVACTSVVTEGRAQKKECLI
jgi:hypothetical protein